MHDALRVDDDVHFFHGDVKEPAGLNHFQPFIEQGGGVYGDFAAHAPGGVLEGLFQRDVFQIFPVPGAEGAAGCRQNQAGDGFRAAVAAVQALENGVVLAVHRKHLHTGPAGFLHDDLPGHDQDFLAGDGEVLACFNGGQSGFEPGGSHDGD